LLSSYCTDRNSRSKRSCSALPTVSIAGFVRQTARARVTASAEVGGQPAASAVIAYVLAGLGTSAISIPPGVVETIRAWDEAIWRELTEGPARE